MTEEERRQVELVEMFKSALSGAKAEKLHAEPPEHLYHYTNAQSLIGILQNDCLWATNALYLNDSSELAYSLEVLEEAIDEALKNTTNEAAKKLLEPFKGRWVTDRYDFFVTCFCKKANLLNQWRVYAQNDGFCLRFDTAKLRALQDDQRARHTFSLIRVIYDEAEQRALLADFLGIVIRYAEAQYPNPGDIDRSEKAMRSDIYYRLLPLLTTFKHPAFEVEHEWRLITVASGVMSYAKYRSGRCGLTPYLECFLLEPDGDRDSARRAKLPISQLLMGPTSSKDIAGNALYGLLHSLKYYDVKVEGSLLPIR